MQTIKNPHKIADFEGVCHVNRWISIFLAKKIHGATKIVPNEWNSIGSSHICFSCPDVKGMVEQLRDACVPIYIETETGSDGKTQA